jgi:D-serine deaminase-like pyridoxal phosphate-dependent protein
MSFSDMIGRSKEELDTPALLLDLNVAEGNIRRMADTILRQAGVQWRPHTKGMKTPALAHKLLAAGAHGVTCAKLGEAEVMASAGIRDILVANQVVTPHKIERLVNLRHHADVKVAVDNPENVAAIDRAALKKGIVQRVLIEVDTGMERAGVLPGAPVLELARQIDACEGVEFAGIMTWESMVLKIADLEERQQAITAALKSFSDSAQLCREAGLPVEIVSCGGTGTYWMSAFAEGITEIQAGGGIYCDRVYRGRFGVDHPYALTIRASVTSRPNETRIICDAGKKTMTNDHGVPEPLGLPPVKELTLSAEHGRIELEAASQTPKVGDALEFIVGYSDTTVVLHDQIYGIRDGVVETVWPLWGRGRLQ